MKKVNSPIEACGLQAKIVHRYGINRSTVCQIFNGKKRATPKQAAMLEEFFMRRGIPLNRWDLIYGVDVEHGQTLKDYVNNKTQEEKYA